MAKILVVEDDARIMELIQIALQEAGYLIMPALCGKTALNWLGESAKPDLVILDIGLPDINGIEICKKIKTTRLTQKIPVIILTGNLDNQSKIQANLSGHADLFLNKPIQIEDLLEAVKTLLENSWKNEKLLRNIFLTKKPRKPD